MNLMEWLAADMSALARAVSERLSSSTMRRSLSEAAAHMAGKGVTGRLRAAGGAIAAADPELSSPDVLALRSHRSDLVRQWACYAQNDPAAPMTFGARLEGTLPFADDPNMSVREAAWMAFRPHLAANLDEGLVALEARSRDARANVRRFAIEVTRPRSVWGAHLGALKQDPERARPLLENTKADRARYVQLAVGNWLNDASKSRPDWVSKVADGWGGVEDRHTEFILRRGTRSMIRNKSKRNVSAALF